MPLAPLHRHYSTASEKSYDASSVPGRAKNGRTERFFLSGSAVFALPFVKREIVGFAIKMFRQKFCPELPSDQKRDCCFHKSNPFIQSLCSNSVSKAFQGMFTFFPLIDQLIHWNSRGKSSAFAFLRSPECRIACAVLVAITMDSSVTPERGFMASSKAHSVPSRVPIFLVLPPNTVTYRSPDSRRTLEGWPPHNSTQTNHFCDRLTERAPPENCNARIRVLLSGKDMPMARLTPRAYAFFMATARSTPRTSVERLML